MPKPQTKKVVDESSEEEEIVNTKKQQKNNAGAAKPVAKKAAKVDSEDSDEETQPAKTGKIAQKVANKKSKAESEDSDEEEAKPAAAKPAEGGKALNHPNEVIVKGLPFSAGEDDLNEFFQECGTIDGVNVLKGQDGRSKGMAFVRFTTEDALKAALGYNGSDFGGRKVTIEKTVPKEQRAPAGGAREFQKSERDPSSSSIFVGNLSYQTTEDSLWSFFENCGEISKIRVAMDQDGRPRGFAHVDFASPDAVESAVQKAGNQLDGRAIRVDYSTPKKNDGGQRGGFGGGNRQGGYGGGNRQGGYGGGNGGNRQRGGRW